MKHCFTPSGPGVQLQPSGTASAARTPYSSGPGPQGKPQYTKKKIDEATLSGNFFDDSVAPNDLDERYYYILNEVSITRDDVLSESMAITGKARIQDSESLQGLDMSFLQGGGVEAAQGLQTGDSIASAFAVGAAKAASAAAAAAKAKAKAGAGAAAKAAAKAKAGGLLPAGGLELPGEDVADVVDEARSQIDKYIEESSEAHALMVKCRQLDFSDQMCQALGLHSKWMEQRHGRGATSHRCRTCRVVWRDYALHVLLADIGTES